MRRTQGLALVAIAGLLLGAFWLRQVDQGAGARAIRAQPPTGTAAPAEPDLAAARRAAGLAACPPGLGGSMPDVTLPCLSGDADVRLRSAPGQPTLVNIWAPWCVPCQRETPELVWLAERAGDRLGLVGVVHESTASEALAFSRDYGVRYPNVLDADGEVLRTFGSGPPVTLFLTADGRVAHVQRGAFRDQAQIAAMVEQYLGVRV